MPNRWNRKLVRFVLFGSPLILAGCASGSMPEGVFGPASEMTPTIPEQTGFEAPAVEAVDPAELMRLAQDLRAKGDFGGAAHFYAQVHEVSPDDVSALIGLGDMLAALGDSVTAADAYGQATALQPARSEARMGLAKASIAMDNPQVAATQFQAVLTANDQDVRAYNGLGVAADLMGDHKAAQEHYRAGLAIDPQNNALLNNLGLSLALSGDFDNGVFMLEELAAAPDASPTTRQNLALAYGLAGREEESERVARVDLDESEIRKNMAFIASHRGDGGSTAIAKALKVELTSIELASGPAVVPPAQVAELQRQALSGEAEASVTTGEASDSWYYEEPIIEPAPSVAVEAEMLPAVEPQLAAATDVDTARGMRGLSTVHSVAGMALAALPMPASRPEARPEPIVETVAAEPAPALEVPIAAPAPTAAPAIEAIAEVSVAEPVFVTQIARAVPAKAGAVPRALLAVPVASVMAKAPAVTTAIVPNTVTVYDSVSAAEYCRGADVGVVNCIASASSSHGRLNGAMAISAAFSFASN